LSKKSYFQPLGRSWYKARPEQGSMAQPAFLPLDREPFVIWGCLFCIREDPKNSKSIKNRCLAANGARIRNDPFAPIPGSPAPRNDPFRSDLKFFFDFYIFFFFFFVFFLWFCNSLYKTHTEESLVSSLPMGMSQTSPPQHDFQPTFFKTLVSPLPIGL